MPIHDFFIDICWKTPWSNQEMNSRSDRRPGREDRHQPYLRSPSVTSSVTCSPSRSTTIFTTSPGDCSRSA